MLVETLLRYGLPGHALETKSVLDKGEAPVGEIGDARQPAGDIFAGPRRACRSTRARRASCKSTGRQILIDILVSSAGIMQLAKLADSENAFTDRQIAANLHPRRHPAKLQGAIVQQIVPEVGDSHRLR